MSKLDFTQELALIQKSKNEALKLLKDEIDYAIYKITAIGGLKFEETVQQIRYRLGQMTEQERNEILQTQPEVLKASTSYLCTELYKAIQEGNFL